MRPEPRLSVRPEETVMDERPRRFHLSRRAWLGVLALGALGLGAAGTAAAPGWLGHVRHGFGHFRGHHGWSEADVRFAIEFWLRDADASEEQTARIVAIASAAHADVHALREAHLAHRAAFVEAIVAADRAALEQLRREELAAAEAASQRLVAALADAAEVLTPEQRRALAEAHAAHHGD
jgi:Spy/CpxP family protein refolding chaperone